MVALWSACEPGTPVDRDDLTGDGPGGASRTRGVLSGLQQPQLARVVPTTVEAFVEQAHLGPGSRGAGDVVDRKGSCSGYYLVFPMLPQGLHDRLVSSGMLVLPAGARGNPNTVPGKSRLC